MMKLSFKITHDGRVEMVDVFNKSPEIAASGVHRAILPIGSIEQHSIHLPVGTDWICAEELGRRIAERLDAYVLPALPFSTCAEHCQFKGTVGLRQVTFMTVIKDIAEALFQQGFDEIGMITWHGGNWALKPAVRELNMSIPGISVAWAVPYDLAHAKLREVFPYYDEDIHAGDFETSCILVTNPEAVGSERVDYVPPVGREFFDYVPFGSVSRDGVWGRPSLASAEKGEKAFQITVDATAEYLLQTWQKMRDLKR
jgi:creatinine amidohydrolase